jgi:hypothetical protein
MKFLWLFFVTASTLLCQAPATSDAKQRFFEYYSGDWAGQGEFSNGSKISAHLSFRADKKIDGSVYRHSTDPLKQIPRLIHVEDRPQVRSTRRFHPRPLRLMP